MDQPRLVGGRYELGGVLGRGGMAEVHMGRDVRLGRNVAVKTLRADLASDPTFQARFRREAQSAASLNHPAIVAVYDTGEDLLNGTPLPYIVMEYVEGTTLRELLQSGRRLLPERALEIVAGVLQALEYSHRNGIIHRDIKPGNVMLTRSGHVKVMDFGIARAVADMGATMTATAAVIGTAQYLSPEQAKGEHVDARSDIYSTGCLLYELLVGRPPFVGDSPVSVAYQHVREDPLPPSQFDPEVPPEIDAVVLKALAKNPENRYQSADEMRADIDRALDGRPVAAPAVMMASGSGGAPTQVMQPTAVIPGGSGTGAYGPGGPGGPPGRYQPPPPKQNKGPMIALITLAVIAVFALAALIGRAIFGGDEGAKTQEVPSVLGQPQQNAVTTLERAQFKASVNGGCAAFNDQYASGQVYRQSPEGQTQATPSSTVTLCISKGTETVTIPDVRDRTPDEAKAQLEDLGFKVQVVDQASADVEKDHVIGTNPAAGANQKKGSTVKLLVSTGPEQVAVPSVVGKQRNDAENILRDAGFQVQINEVEAPDEKAGTVLDQNPGAGAKVDPGTTVTLTVAKQPQQQLVTVRNVVGFTEDAAKQALENDGLKVKVQNQNPPDPTKPDGTVVSQSIPPGTQVAQNTEITIMVNHPQGG
ncbi:MAG TPA: Stk1 family PASTA domain-containing Ser/Thr kinase [Actinomycetes bacterium]|jgi:serine/threonine-protein kinase|nr:Stk1 family PASTA domain-containing Ser/Thr kinase [Actinomycetes bacterium]